MSKYIRLTLRVKYFLPSFRTVGAWRECVPTALVCVPLHEPKISSCAVRTVSQKISVHCVDFFHPFIDGDSGPSPKNFPPKYAVYPSLPHPRDGGVSEIFTCPWLFCGIILLASEGGWARTSTRLFHFVIFAALMYRNRSAKSREQDLVPERHSDLV